MQKIQFLGASGGVTGSSYLLTADNGDTVLIDLGMFQGEDNLSLNNLPLNFNVEFLKAVFLTHAHLDHCGRLPMLIKFGFRGKVFTTEVTKEITHLSLLDTVSINKEEKRPLLYINEDVEQIINNTEIVSYDQQFSVGDFKVTFRNAGHIIGSASIEISDKQTVVFSGDLGNYPQDLIKPTQFFQKGDFVVMESTYGDRVHKVEDVFSILQDEINQVEETKGILLIPAFSIERAQEVIHIIGHLKQDGKIKNETPIFLDSPLAIEVVEIFKTHAETFNLELLKDSHPFDFPGMFLTKTGDESKAISKIENPKVIIAGSGMMEGGRISYHLKDYAQLPTSRILIVGYQAVGTMGRKILEGAKSVNIHGEMVNIEATVTNIEGLSSHADQPKLVNWLKNIKDVKKVFLVHGEDSARAALAEKIKTETKVEVILPVRDQTFELNN